MAKKLQLRRGTTAQHSSFTGDVGECTVDTDKDTLVVHDNSTAGGQPLLREDLNNLANDSVTYAHLQNVAANSILGNNTGSADDAIELTAAQVRTFLNVADGANNYSHPNHSGDVTSSGDGATTIANDAVTYAKMQNVAANSILGNNTGSAANAIELTAAQVRALAAAAGTGTVNTFGRTQSGNEDDASSDSAIDMSLGNFIKVGSTNPSGTPTNLVVGTSGFFHAESAAPISWNSVFKHPAGLYTQPTAFPAIAPWYIAASDKILVGSWTQGIV